MKEFKKIVETYKNIDFKKNKAAIATVVRVEGSSYRRAGARMIMTDDGRWTGAISGGCLEGDALRKARKAILDNSPSLVTYDTMEDKSAMELGIGLGCNGIIDVFIEPITHEDNNQLDLIRSFLDHKKADVMATIYKVDNMNGFSAGDRWLLSELKEGNNEVVIQSLREDMKVVLESHKSIDVEYRCEENQTLNVFIEFLHPGLDLIIFGAGYDAIPLARIASEVGFNVTVTDDCVAHIAPVKFPTVDSLIHASREQVVCRLSINPFTAAVLLSHNYKYDLQVLKSLITTDIRYIGIMGPSKRFEKMKVEIESNGTVFSVNTMKKIFSPVGLDLGAETPEEIAISIVSEIQAFFNNRSGLMLKDRTGPIHKREQTLKLKIDHTR